MQLIQDHIYFIEAPNRASFPHCHCLFIDDDVRVLLDTGCSRQQAEELALGGIDVVLNSHFHIDHILHDYLFPKAQVWVHNLDAPAVISREVLLDCYGFFGEERAIGEAFVDDYNSLPSPVHRLLQGGEVLDFGKVKLLIVHTPGHTPGHCIFYHEKTGLVIMGDIELSGFGPWYANACCDLDDLITSIKKCMEIDPPRVVTSHKGIINDNIQKRLQDYLNVIYRKEANIFNALREPRTIEYLVERQLYYERNIVLSPRDYFFEKMGVLKHLERLIKHREIVREGIWYYQA